MLSLNDKLTLCTFVRDNKYSKQYSRKHEEAMLHSTVTKKQTTIPDEVRAALKIRPAIGENIDLDGNRVSMQVP